MRTRPRRPGFRWVVALGLAVGVAISSTSVAVLYDAMTARPWTPPPGLHFVQTDGYPTRFIASGPEIGRPIVLLHGSFESAGIWMPVLRILAEHHHVEAYDLAGYGYTERTGSYDVHALSDQLAAFLTARHLRDPVLVGHSMGAGVIAQFLLDHPHTASGAVFLDGDGLTANYPTWILRDLVPEPFRTALYRSLLGSGFLVRHVFSATCGPHCPPLTPAELDMVQRPFFVQGAEAAFFAIANQPLVGVGVARRLLLREVTVPKVVVVGSNDPELPAAGARATALAIGAPPPTILRTDGHLALWSDPRGVAAAVEALATSHTPHPHP